ncbi:hypothetical protein D6833_00050 [Candidatus Parcubacteria bacterium]|nr:MAG: hypothetical protein D6833_00050 [Candidatus Parcubacteria bacterium]
MPGSRSSPACDVVSETQGSRLAPCPAPQGGFSFCGTAPAQGAQKELRLPVREYLLRRAHGAAKSGTDPGGQARLPEKIKKTPLPVTVE